METTTEHEVERYTGRGGRVVYLLLTLALILLALSSLAVTSRVTDMVLTGIVVSQIILIGLVFTLVTRRQQHELARILALKEEREQTSVRLEATNQQLRAANQQLEAANQQFEATNQQLEAGEQQLRATNQQLQAVNQELAAHQQQIRESERRYRLLFSNMACGFAFHRIICNEKGEPDDYEFIEVNDAFCTMTGLTQRGVVGRTVTAIFPGIRSAEPDLVSLYGRVALTGENLSYQFFFEPLERWYDVLAYCPMKGYFAVVFTDVSERMRAEEQLKGLNQQLCATNQQLSASEQQLRATNQQLRATNQQLCASEESLRVERNRIVTMLNAMPDGVCIIGSDYSVRYANPVLVGSFGEPADQPCYRYFHGRNAPCQECLLREVCTNRATMQWERVSGVNGRWYEHIATPLEMDGGEVVNLEVVRDISDRKKTEEELRKTHKLESLGVLAGGIAHDFNNLLGGAFGYIDMALGLVDTGSVLHRYLDRAMLAYTRARELSSQLLTFSKGGSPVKKVISVVHVVREACNLALSGSNTSSSIALDEVLPNVEADEGQLSQVLNNVLLNARQAMPQGGTVIVTVGSVTLGKGEKPHCEPGLYLRITIRDQGVGIAAEHLSSIFDPFFTTKQQGSGLGLATSHSIIKKHGGTIEVASTLAEGTVFSIFLPATSAPAPHTPLAGGELQRGSGRVLVMDDEPIIRSMVEELLGRAGYRVDTARNGEDALELYATARSQGDPYGVVILDLTVSGGMGGDETIRKLRGLDSEVRAIVSSGYSDNPVVANFPAWGFKGAVIKPYRATELCEAVARVLAAA